MGREGEDRAASFLRSIGYQILERNKRYPIGEIDILAKDRQTVVLVEVKAGRTGQYGHAYERVGPQKRRKLLALAALLEQEHPTALLRIDLINVDERGEVLHFQDAVQA